MGFGYNDFLEFSSSELRCYPLCISEKDNLCYFLEENNLSLEEVTDIGNGVFVETDKVDGLLNTLDYLQNTKARLMEKDEFVLDVFKEYMRASSYSISKDDSLVLIISCISIETINNDLRLQRLYLQARKEYLEESNSVSSFVENLIK